MSPDHNVRLMVVDLLSLTPQDRYILHLIYLIIYKVIACQPYGWEPENRNPGTGVMMAQLTLVRSTIFLTYETK